VLLGIDLFGPLRIRGYLDYDSGAVLIVMALLIGIFLRVLFDQFGALLALTQDLLDIGPVYNHFNVHLSLRWE
jgi:hypothetical protein